MADYYFWHIPNKKYLEHGPTEDLDFEKNVGIELNDVDLGNFATESPESPSYIEELVSNPISQTPILDDETPETAEVPGPTSSPTVTVQKKVFKTSNEPRLHFSGPKVKNGSILGKIQPDLARIYGIDNRKVKENNMLRDKCRSHRAKHTYHGDFYYPKFRDLASSCGISEDAVTLKIFLSWHEINELIEAGKFSVDDVKLAYSKAHSNQENNLIDFHEFCVMIRLLSPPPVASTAQEEDATAVQEGDYIPDNQQEDGDSPSNNNCDEDAEFSYADGYEQKDEFI